MSTPPRNDIKTAAFQGARGAYSDMAARGALPGVETVPCGTFAEAFAAVRDKRADRAVIPVDNTLAGRVADVHELLPEGGLYVTGEYFLPIRHCLLGVKGAKAADITEVWSHPHALPQCRNMLRRLGARACIHADTAGAAEDVAKAGDKSRGAIASALAAELYGLDIIEENVQDAAHNATRFLILAREPVAPDYKAGERYLTSIVFEVKNTPAALYKALTGLALRDINLVKLESYIDARFRAARFYAEAEGHPAAAAMTQALADLQHNTAMLRVLGTYEADGFRNAS
jgi:prephenate dehydratase